MPRGNIGRRFFLRGTGITAISWSLSVGLNAASPLEGLLAARSSDEKAKRPADLPGAAGSRPLRGVKVGKPSPLADNGGDTWVAAWADDDSLYSPSNDTGGFHKAANANIAFNRIGGSDPGKLSGFTVNPMR